MRKICKGKMGINSTYGLLKGKCLEDYKFKFKKKIKQNETYV